MFFYLFPIVFTLTKLNRVYLEVINLHYMFVFCQDMGIEEPEFVDLVDKIENLEQQLLSHPLNKVNRKPHFF